MSTKEIDRFAVLKQVQDKKLTQSQGAEILGITDRQVRNLLAAVKAAGAEGLISKKRGKAGNNRKPKELKEKVLSLVQSKYEDFGPTFASEKIAERDDVDGLIGSRLKEKADEVFLSWRSFKEGLLTIKELQAYAEAFIMPSTKALIVLGSIGQECQPRVKGAGVCDSRDLY